MAAFIDIEVVIPEYQVILQGAATVLGTLTDVTRYVVKGASSVDYPTLASRAGQNIAIGATFSQNDANYGNDSFNLNEKLGDFFGVNVHQDKQNRFNNLQDSTQETIKAIARQADGSMIAKLVAASATNKVTPTASIKNDIIDMKAFLLAKKVPADDLYLAVTPAEHGALEKLLTDFIRFDADVSGVVGKISGVKVIVSTDAALTEAMMYHKKAGAYAFQGETVFLQTVVAGASAIKYELSRMFGGKATQSGDMVVLRKA